jgi:leucyl aminopeptidase
MIELPDFGALKITQSAGAPTKKQYDALDQLTIVLPERPPEALFRALPQGAQLRKLLAHTAGKGNRRVSTRLSNARATAVTLGTFKEGDAFTALTWARKLVAASLEHNPAKVGLLAVGLDAAAKQQVLTALIAAIEAAAFELPAFKTEKKAAAASKLRAVQVLDATPKLDLADTHAQALGNNIARWLTALPPNKLSASAYREIATELAQAYGLDDEFFGERELQKLGAGAFLAVAQGNADRDAGILRLKYRPAKQKGPELALVGKGIIFDTGGTNLKPFKGMLDMHTDMQGSAVALGTGIALARLRVPFAFDVWLAITENRLSARAYKSQDVVHALNGTTIQVIHTDAEGRMVLADTLALAAREQPKLIIDYATLTGSCVAALTDRYSGVFSNRNGAHEILLRNGRDSGERVWPFPLDEDFEEALQSETADIKQCAADGHGDHILAARFLMRFVPKTIPWIHMDLSAGQHKGGLAHVPSEITGFGVRYTLELLRRTAGSPSELVERLSA